MTLETLSALTDDELRSLITQADTLLRQRDRDRKEKALSDAKAILISAGLSLLDLATDKGLKGIKLASYRTGFQYRHPSRPELVWNAKGQKPNWLRLLEKEGKRAVEMGASVTSNPRLPVNDNRKTPAEAASPDKAGPPRAASR